MTVSFELDGHKFVALNGGPDFAFSEADLVPGELQEPGRSRLVLEQVSEGGEEGLCGWLKDKFGLSWQIVPTALPELLADPDPEKSQRVMEAMLKMRKIEIEVLERAAAQA